MIKKLDEEEIVQILNRYGKEETKSLAKEFNISINRLITIVSKSKRGKYENSSDVEIIKKIIEMYDDGFNVRHMAIEIGCSPDKIEYVLKKNGLKASKSKKALNYNPFENYTNPHSQYWIGVLAADGCLSEGDRVSLGQCEAHKDLLESYIRFLENRVTLHERRFKKFGKEFTHYNVSFRNKDVHNFLDTVVGITPRKSDTLEIKIPITFDFLRGAIDGDGSIEPNHYRIRLCSNSKKFLKQVMDFLLKFGIKSNLYGPNSSKSLMEIQINERLSLLKLISYLYYNDCTYYLNDKYNNAQQLRNKLLTRFKFRELSLENPERNL